MCRTKIISDYFKAPLVALRTCCARLLSQVLVIGGVVFCLDIIRPRRLSQMIRLFFVGRPTRQLTGPFCIQSCQLVNIPFSP